MTTPGGPVINSVAYKLTVVRASQFYTLIRRERCQHPIEDVDDSTPADLSYHRVDMIDAKIAGLLDFSDQVVLVTGASRGIGRAIAAVFAQAGARVGLMARNEEALAHVAAELGAEQSLVLPADVSEEEQVKNAVQETMAAWGRVDVLVNNAGLISFGPLGEIEPADWRRVIEVNLTGAYLCARAVAPIMEKQGRGQIVNITSVTAQTGGVSGGVHYSASKGGVASLTKSLARDLAPAGVRVNSIAPGQIDADPELLTPEARQEVTAMIPLGRLGEPEEIAYGALFLASPMAGYITGATLDVNGGILKR
jgi:3-oxoacyl-[acyl-carrier protein] reductase